VPELSDILLVCHPRFWNQGKAKPAAKVVAGCRNFRRPLKMDLKLIQQQLWPQALISPDAKRLNKSGFYSPLKFRWPDRFNSERPVQIQEVFVAGHDVFRRRPQCRRQINVIFRITAPPLAQRGRPD